MANEKCQMRYGKSPVFRTNLPACPAPNRKSPPPDSRSWQRVVKFPVVSFLLLQLSPHNQRAALMPIMVGMMVCAVVVVCAVENHHVYASLLSVLILHRRTGVNELQ